MRLWLCLSALAAVGLLKGPNTLSLLLSLARLLRAGTLTDMHTFSVYLSLFRPKLVSAHVSLLKPLCSSVYASLYVRVTSRVSLWKALWLTYNTRLVDGENVMPRDVSVAGFMPRAYLLITLVYTYCVGITYFKWDVLHFLDVSWWHECVCIHTQVCVLWFTSVNEPTCVQ